MDIFQIFLTPEGLFSLLTLSMLEIALGIDNVIFVSIIIGKLPKERHNSARRLWIIGALILRFCLLMSISYLAGLIYPIFSLFGNAFTGRDLIMMFGGLFLLAKSTLEIHTKLEGIDHEQEATKKVGARAFGMVIGQVLLIDLVFSLDSVITAIGLANHIPIMVAAIVIALAIMLLSSSAISAFVDRHPTLKILALSFLLMVGLTLFVEGFGVHVPKGYIYSAMAFSLLVETLNIRLRKKTQTPPVHLR
ncbi:TerC family protein [bacterium]|nr:TerC family protein [bacterium]